ncbi:MAG: hypothetical protein ACLGJE_03800, partial [Gammaproteobacteria bacterium]
RTVMKKIIITSLLAIAPFVSFAQTKAFDKFQNVEGIESVKHRGAGIAGKPAPTLVCGVVKNLVLHHFLKREAPQRVLQEVADVLA